MSDVQRLSVALANRYTVERELGRGGMAIVYLARDLKHDRNVAIKVLSPEIGAAVGAERFLLEIKTTANLRHPHIVPLYDSGEAQLERKTSAGRGPTPGAILNGILGPRLRANPRMRALLLKLGGRPFEK